MLIGDLARAARCTVETVRYYEKAGLLPEPDRTPGNYRTYALAHVERLRAIRTCRALDMTHDEIRDLLGAMERPADGCAAIDELMAAHLAHVDARITELQRLRGRLATLREGCQGERSVAACGIVAGLAAMGEETVGGPGQNRTGAQGGPA